MKKIQFVSILAAVFLAIITATLIQFYLPSSSDSHKKEFLVKKGQGAFEIANNLQRERFVKNKSLFLLYLVFSRSQKKLKAGDYLLSPSMTISQIAKQLIEGSQTIVRITIPEGWNLDDISNYLAKKKLCQKDEFFSIVGAPRIDYNKTNTALRPKDFSSRFAFLKNKPKNVSLEGYLFPDTYFVSKSSNCQQLIELFLKNFSKKLTPRLRRDISSQHKTIFEIVTMASLLEKEAKTDNDKEIISGILWKRLEYGIPLQVDATISYLTNKKSAKISLKETKINSPYNTYQHLGLPLGPICNPGIKSILAAIYPKKSNFWYYLSTPEGKTIFSKTLREHNVAKQKYLKLK